MFNRILLPVDLGQESSWQKALPVAIGMCQQSGASLHVMTVVPDFGLPIVEQYFPEGFESEMAEKALGQLKDFVEANVPAELNVQHIVGEGSIYQSVLKVAEETGADLIVLAAHRPELQDYLLGPNASRIVRHGRCSVLVVRD